MKEPNPNFKIFSFFLAFAFAVAVLFGVQIRLAPPEVEAEPASPESVRNIQERIEARRKTVELQNEAKWEEAQKAYAKKKIKEAQSRARHAKDNDFLLPIRRESDHPLLINESTEPSALYPYRADQHLEFADADSIEEFIKGKQSGSETFKDVVSIGVDTSFEMLEEDGAPSQALQQLADCEALRNSLRAMVVRSTIGEEDLQTLSRFGNLRQFDLRGYLRCNRSSWRKFLLGFKKLEKLNLSSMDGFSDEDLSALAGMTSLEAIDLRRIKRGEAKLLKTVLALPKLEYLYFGSWGGKMFMQNELKLPPTLKGLWAVAYPPIFDAIKNHSKLDWLVLDGGRASPNELSTSLSASEGIRLRMSRVSITGDDESDRAGTDVELPVASLELDSCILRDCPTFTLASLPMARVLSFAHTKETDNFFAVNDAMPAVEYFHYQKGSLPSAPMLKVLPRFPNLKALSLPSGRLGDRSTKYLLALKKLELLDLSWNYWFNDVRPFSSLPELKVLRLRSRGPITGLIDLVKSAPKLTELDIWHRAISEEELANLRKAVEAVNANGRKLEMSGPKKGEEAEANSSDESEDSDEIAPLPKEPEPEGIDVPEEVPVTEGSAKSRKEKEPPEVGPDDE